MAGLLTCLATSCVQRRVAQESPPSRQTSSSSPQVRELVTDLGGTKEARNQAVDELIAQGSAAVPALVEALKSPNFNTRWHAVSTLGQIRDKAALPALIDRILVDEDNHVRWRSIWAVNQMPDPSTLSSLREHLEDANPTVRWNAAVALSTMQAEDVVPFLTEGLQSSSTWVRWEAVNALGRVHNVAARDALISCLSDPVDRIRWEAASSLGAMKGPQVVEALTKALKDSVAGVRWRAGMSLSHIGDKSAIGALERAFEREQDQFARGQFEGYLLKLKGEGSNPQ